MNWATILVPQIRRRRAVAVAAEFIIFALNGPLPGKSTKGIHNEGG